MDKLDFLLIRSFLQLGWGLAAAQPSCNETVTDVRFTCPVASLRLMSPGAVNDGVAFLPEKSDYLFSPRPTDYRHHSHPLHFIGDRLSSVIVNSPAKIFRLSHRRSQDFVWSALFRPF